MELFIWPEEYGLPSVDPLSLQMMAYCRFSGAPNKTIFLDRSWRVVTHSVPLFNHGFNIRITSFKLLLEYLQKQGYDADNKLNHKDKNDLQAYYSLVSRKLEPALLYLLWMRQDNYAMVTRPWFARRTPFPTNFFLPGFYQRASLKKIFEIYGDTDESKIEKQIDEEAQKCIDLLARKLGDKEYIFGQNPTSIDALVFGYLAPIIKMPLPSTASLKNCLTTHRNLEQFVERIMREFFPSVKEESKQAKISDSSSQWLDILGSSLFAVTATIAYAFIHLRVIVLES